MNRADLATTTNGNFCSTGKIVYDTKPEAVRALGLVTKRKRLNSGNTKLAAYFCNACRKYHIGRVRDTGKTL